MCGCRRARFRGAKARFGNDGCATGSPARRNKRRYRSASGVSLLQRPRLSQLWLSKYGYRNYGYRNYGYRNYGYRNYGYRRYGYGGYGYRPYGYYGGYGYPYWRPGISLWFGF
jgi:hypothetical protein